MSRYVLLLVVLVLLLAACDSGPAAVCNVTVDAESGIPLVTVGRESGDPEVRSLEQEERTTTIVAGQGATVEYTLARELTYENGNVYTVTGTMSWTRDPLEIQAYEMTIEGGDLDEPQSCTKE